MRLVNLKTVAAVAVVGLALTAGRTASAAEAATTEVTKPTVLSSILAGKRPSTTTRRNGRLEPGKWRHPANLPADAETAERSPAFENAAGNITGTAFLPVVLVDFSDNQAERTLHTQAAFQNMLFQDGYPHGAGSLRDYYQDQSGRLFDVTGQVSPWLRMPRTYSTYVGSKYGYQSAEPNDFTLIREAAAAADASMNFCNADTDRDGFVDSFFVVHAGPGAEEGRVSSRLWSVKWDLPTAYTTQDVCANGQRVKIQNFTIEPEEYVTAGYTAPGAPARMISIGIFAHEFGHALGLPDLYDTDSSSTGGVGHWCVMASGSWGFNGGKPWLPTPFSAWAKLKLGWITPQNVTQNRLGVAIPSADAPFVGRFTGVYRLAAGGSATSKEYFLVENRQAIGWARDFPTGGLAIWQIDDNIDGNANDSHRQVELLMADGMGQLDDAGDLFPGTYGTRYIDGTTSPNTNTFTGAATGVAIRSIGDAGATTRADLIVSASTTTSDSTPPSVSGPFEQIDVPNTITSTTVPVRITWSATDSGGVTAYEFYASTNGAAYVKQGAVPATATSHTFTLTTGVKYQFAVRARDAAGNWSALSYGPAVTPGLTDDTVFTSLGSWSRYTGWANALNGTGMTSSVAGTSMQLTFTGRDIALVAPKFAGGGRAQVLCDGVFYGYADLQASATTGMNTVFWCSFDQATTHTIKIVVEGTAARPRFDVDAFAILR